MVASLTSDAADARALAEVLRQAVNRADTDAIVACWAPDGVLLPPNHPAIHGTTAIHEYFARVFATRRLTFTFTESSVEVFGDVAVVRLSYTAVVTAPGGETTEDAGKGIHVCTRRSDGSWQLAQDIWNSDRQPNAASRR